MRRLLASVLSAAALSGVSALAQVPASERVPITDADRLQSLGFPRDAENVFDWSKARPAGAYAQNDEGFRVPDSWGTSTGYDTIMNYDLEAADPGEYYLHNGASQGSWCDGSPTAECLGYAGIEAPEGAELRYVTGWAHDESPDSDLHVAVLEACQAGTGPLETTILVSADFDESAGDYLFALYLGDVGVTLNNRDCAYTVRLKFTDAGEPPRGSAIRVRRLRADWVRQVSPAPAAATFGDVPTDHPFFQYIEALAKSGITGGCNASPPLYCPNEPLTRGQMAVFLAKALGLQWP